MDEIYSKSDKESVVVVKVSLRLASNVCRAGFESHCRPDRNDIEDVISYFDYGSLDPLSNDATLLYLHREIRGSRIAEDMAEVLVRLRRLVVHVPSGVGVRPQDAPLLKLP